MTAKVHTSLLSTESAESAAAEQPLHASIDAVGPLMQVTLSNNKLRSLKASNFSINRFVFDSNGHLLDVAPAEKHKVGEHSQVHSIAQPQYFETIESWKCPTVFRNRNHL